MATKPSVIPTWATGTNYSTGPAAIVGTPTKVAPSAGVRTEGHIPETAPGAQHENYDRNLLGQWMTYVDDLHNSTDFLNKNYTMTGTWSFTGSHTVVNIHATGDVDADGDVTAVNMIASGDISAGDDCTIDGDFLYGTPPLRRIVVPLTAFTEVVAGNWTRAISPGSQAFWSTSNNEVSLIASVFVPADCTINNVAAGVNPGATPSSEGMKLQVWRLRHDFEDPPSEGAWEQQGTTAESSGTSAQFLQVTEDYAIDNYSTAGDDHGDELIIRITSSDVASTTADLFYSCLVTFTDPGPRNH